MSLSFLMLNENASFGMEMFASENLGDYVILA
jgi:hypothetical protein